MQVEIEAEIRAAWSWAVSTEHVKVIPHVVAEAYKIKRNKKTVTIPKVKLIVLIGNSRHIGEHLYKQDREMSNKIDEIYLHYFRKSEYYKHYLKQLKQ